MRADDFDRGTATNPKDSRFTTTNHSSTTSPTDFQGNTCSPKALVAQATADLSPWIGQSSEAETSDDHRAIEVEDSSHATPPDMLSPNELATIISSSGEPAEAAPGAGEASPESEAGPPDGLFSGPSQKWPSPVDSPTDLLTQADTADVDASPPLG